MTRRLMHKHSPKSVQKGETMFHKFTVSIGEKQLQDWLKKRGEDFAWMALETVLEQAGLSSADVDDMGRTNG